MNRAIIDNNIENWNCEILHNAIKTSFSNHSLQFSDLEKNADFLICLLSKLPSIDTFKFLKYIDNQFLGLSINFIKEARLNYHNYLTEEYLLFLFRTSYYLACCPEREILTPAKARLCSLILFDDVNINFFKGFQEKMHVVDKQETISKKDKKQLKKNLYLQYFHKYMYRMLPIDPE